MVKAYKVVEKTKEEGVYSSIGFVELKYELHKETVAPEDSLLFVYDSLKSVLGFIPHINSFSKSYVVFEVESDSLEPLDWMLYAGSYDNPKQAISNFWKNRNSYSNVQTKTPKGTVGAKSVRLTKRISKTRLRLAELFIRIFV